jgi:hypothetical protein
METPVIPANKVVDEKRIFGKRGGGKRALVDADTKKRPLASQQVKKPKK